MEEQTFLLGVYDHLRREGEASETYLDGARYVGTYYTEPDFDLYAMSAAYPGLRTGGSTSILLEIFEVDMPTLKTADYYEGTSDYASHLNVFKRIEIDTIFGPCFIYEYGNAVIGKPIIESGDWFKHKQLLREKVSNINNQEGGRWGLE